LAYKKDGDERQFAEASRKEVLRAREEIASACSVYGK